MLPAIHKSENPDREEYVPGANSVAKENSQHTDAWVAINFPQWVGQAKSIVGSVRAWGGAGESFKSQKPWKMPHVPSMTAVSPSLFPTDTRERPK